MTRFFILSSRDNNFSFSLLISLVTGIFVHLAIIFAISLSVTVSLNILFFSVLFNSSSSFSNFGMVPCLRMAACSRSYLFSAWSSLNFASSISFFFFLIFSFRFFSLFQASVNSCSFCFIVTRFLSISSRRFLDISSFSFLIA